MLNIIIPMSGDSLYETSSDFIYPKLLTEVANKTLLEYSQVLFDSLTEESNTVYVAPAQKLDQLGLTSIIKTITNGKGKIVRLQGQTKGAVCSCLMAIDDVSLEDELIISSADHYINDDLQQILSDFRQMNADAGVLTFESVHPKWSFVKLDSDGKVIQSSEKSAISRNAVAGLYYFKRAGDFVEAAKNLIRKGNDINGSYYLSSCLNELVLSGKNIRCRPLKNSLYHNFYDAHAVKSFELAQSTYSKSVYQWTIKYIEAFNARKLDAAIAMFENNAILIEPQKSFTGANEIKSLLSELFSTPGELQLIHKNIVSEGDKSVIQFELLLNGDKYSGVDFIEWSSNGKIVKLSAYL